MPANQVRPGGLHPVGLAGVVEVGHVAVPAAEYAVWVDRTADRFARAVDPPGIGQGEHRPKQRLAGHAAPIGAFAADEFAFDDRYGQPGGATALGDVLTDGSRPDNNDVIGVVLHIYTSTRRAPKSRHSSIPVLGLRLRYGGSG
jgi:hypothetical protein